MHSRKACGVKSVYREDYLVIYIIVIHISRAVQKCKIKKRHSLHPLEETDMHKTAPEERSSPNCATTHATVDAHESV